MPPSYARAASILRLRNIRKHVSRLAPQRTLVTGGRPEPKKGDKVVVAMSGGVDSSVTARLLTDKGYDLSAIFMRNWDTRDESGSDTGCEWEKDWEDVQRVCKTLDLPCRMIDLSKEYWNRVFEPSLRVWESGQTPNPDIWCNREVKFGALMQHLYSNDTWLATGHYARKGLSTEPTLLRARDTNKDQSYYLAAMPQSSLARTLFPIGDLTKVEVRALAEKYNLPTAARPESMGICFIGEKRKFSDFIAQYIQPKPGPIISLETGRKIGQHQGLWTFTIGEGARISGARQKMYVARKNIKSNAIYAVSGMDHFALYTTSLRCSDFTWMSGSFPPHDEEKGSFRALAQFRHRMAPAPCTVSRRVSNTWAAPVPEEEKTVIIDFDEPQFAVAPGQIAAVYIGEQCMGCGPIERVGHETNVA